MNELNTVCIFGRDILADSEGCALRYLTREDATTKIGALPGRCWFVLESAVPHSFFIERIETSAV